MLRCAATLKRSDPRVAPARPTPSAARVRTGRACANGHGGPWVRIRMRACRGVSARACACLCLCAWVWKEALTRMCRRWCASVSVSRPALSASFLAASVLDTKMEPAAARHCFWTLTYVVSLLAASVLDTKMVPAAAGHSIWILTFSSSL